MNVTRVEKSNRSSRWLMGCGCLAAVAIVGAFMVAMAGIYLYAFSSPSLLADFALRMGGAVPMGETDAVFRGVTPRPTPVIQNPVAEEQVTVIVGGQRQETVNVDPSLYTVVTGNTEDGTPVATASFTEEGLLQLCRQRSNLCAEGDDRFRNVEIDLRPGGMVVYAEANVGVWQRLGVVMQLDAAQRGFNVVGVDVGGVLFDPATLPTDFRGPVSEIERVGNDMLDQLIIQAGGQNYALTEVMIDDTALTLTLR